MGKITIWRMDFHLPLVPRFGENPPIRNALERRGHNPLRFFLTCLEGTDARVPELIPEELIR